jgi:superfamily II DNA or RNA helicase
VRAERAGEGVAAALMARLDVQPWDFQKGILEQLQAERELHGRWKNLVVAATGTGKTVVAALDYRRVREQLAPARLLFVAHREEILQQSLATFRAVLRDGAFGELWVGGKKPVDAAFVFASVQTLSHQDVASWRPDEYDVVIVDEFHHAAAPTYRALLEHLRPRLLLGLTATPERADGQSVLEWFDGHVAVELRLWHALERGLLCPFQYFGVHDETDLTAVRWTRGRYDVAALEGVYTGNQARVRLVMQQLVQRVLDVRRMRAFGFCVGVGHAQFMASEFSRLGVPAVAVHGGTPDVERESALRDLRERRVNVVFSVDVFGEGVDVPEVDTILMLRPTESATVFLQQLGRGLRHYQDKSCVTVLDFIGNAHKNFRFDLRYRALTGATRAGLVEAVEQDFPLLPSGCSMQLDRVAQDIVVGNLRNAVRGAGFLVSELKTMGVGTGLARFLDEARLELEDVYRGAAPAWTMLRRRAFEGVAAGASVAQEERLLKAAARLIHIDDVERLKFYLQWLAAEAPAEPRDHRERLWLLQLYLQLGGQQSSQSLPAGRRPLLDMLAEVWRFPAVRDELRELFGVLLERVDHLAYGFDEVPEVPLRVHCRYSRDEALAAFGQMDDTTGTPIREGVWQHKASGCDVFFVTLQKSEREYSPTTMYRDYAISSRLFHWESQSTTRAADKTGRRYQAHGRGSGTYALLFVRQTKKDGRGLAVPYTFLGAADYVSHEGERPMGIVWELHREMPSALTIEMRVAA